MFTDPLLRNGFHNPVFLLLRLCIFRALPSNGRCLHIYDLATRLFSTIPKWMGSAGYVVTMGEDNSTKFSRTFEG
jgi:hypothetical protein